MNDPVLQWQIVTTEPDKLVDFYRELFGWKIGAKNALGYRQVETGNGGFHGGLWPAPPTGHSFVQLFIGVPDVPLSVRRAMELGAKIIVPLTKLPDGDEMAVLADPCGVTFGLMRRD